MLFECLVNDPEARVVVPPFSVDFDGEPHAGDFVYRPTPTGEEMYQVQGRFWRKQAKVTRSEILQSDVRRLVHVCFLGVKLVATARAAPDAGDLDG